MNFKEATDRLFDRISHERLAETLGVSVAAIRQARLQRAAKAHRDPPKNWELAVMQLAMERAKEYARLAEALKRVTISSKKNK